MKVKICGITRQADAAIAVRMGAHALGFIFALSSKRYISPEQARVIVSTLPSSVVAVGVFVDAPRSEILDVAERSGVHVIQLHGDESPEDASGHPCPVWKAFRVGPGFDAAALARFTVDACLLDALVPGQHGGTGQRFDWTQAVAAKKFGRIILSGGLTPENVAEAVRVVAPYAIDVSSGVESSPGVKDHQKIIHLFRAIDHCRSKEPICSSS